MHHYQWYVLVAVNYFFGPLFFCFVMMISILRIMKVVSPEKYNMILHKLRRLSRISRWERKGQFKKVVARYKILAEKKKRHQYFYLGLSHLYQYNWKEALNYFERHLKIAVGSRQILRTKNYIGAALLQGRDYQRALRVYEECRQQGHVFIIPYVLSLLLTRQYTRAQEFYEMHPTPGWDHNLMVKLLAFDKTNPDSLTIIKDSVQKLDHHLYLFRSSIDDIVDHYELEMFFQSPTALQTLHDEITLLCSEISLHESFFESSKLQWIRKLLVEYAPRTLSKQIIWFEGIEVFIDLLSMKQLKSVFAKHNWVYQNSVHHISHGEYERFLHAVVPSSAKEVMRYDHFMKFELFEDEKTELGFELHMDSENRRGHLKVIPWQEVRDLKD